MAQHYHPSYCSNNYRKYREQKLSKNNQGPNSNLSEFTPQSFSYKSQFNRNNRREHLQTFGKQTGRFDEFSKPNYCSNQLLIKQKDWLQCATAGNSEFQISSAISKRNYELQYKEPLLELHNGSNYISHRSEKIQPFANANQKTQIKRFRFERQTQLYEGRKQQVENFEDSIISRRKTYDRSYLESRHQSFKPESDTQFAGKTYKSTNLGVEKLQTENFELEIGKSKNRKILGEFPVSPAYQNRNQMIKDKLIQQSFDKNPRILKQPQHQQEPFYSLNSRRSTLSSQIKTAQVTPEKSGRSLIDERNASQQRRKSLIEKSQMLKQKLSKLNAASNSKGLENHQNYENKKGQFEKENLTQHNTARKHVMKTFQIEVQKAQKNTGKRLNFDQNSYQIEPLKCVNRDLNQSERKSSCRETENFIQKQSLLINTQNLHTPNSSIGSIGERTLKKISELNEKINSRLESILKNYG